MTHHLSTLMMLCRARLICDAIPWHDMLPRVCDCGVGAGACAVRCVMFHGLCV